jgi:predicted glutamine amidotransferase
MCRLLLVKAQTEFDIDEHLRGLAIISKQSKEYQGHGWGCAYLENGRWKLYRNIKPVWEDDLSRFGKTTLLVGHARSAFKDEGIAVENNMPFYDDPYVFIFNGELRGVRISELGRIGAEKIFNFIKRFNHGDMLAAITTGTEIIEKQSRYVRAMNIVIADKTRAYVASLFNEDPKYFTLHYSQTPEALLIASDPLPGARKWQKIDQRTVRAFE